MDVDSWVTGAIFIVFAGIRRAAKQNVGSAAQNDRQSQIFERRRQLAAFADDEITEIAEEIGRLSLTRRRSDFPGAIHQFALAGYVAHFARDAIAFARAGTPVIYGKTTRSTFAPCVRPRATTSPPVTRESVHTGPGSFAHCTIPVTQASALPHQQSATPAVGLAI